MLQFDVTRELYLGLHRCPKSMSSLRRPYTPGRAYANSIIVGLSRCGKERTCEQDKSGIKYDRRSGMSTYEKYCRAYDIYEAKDSQTSNPQNLGLFELYVCQIAHISIAYNKIFGLL